MKTYVLGSLGERVAIVKKCGGEHSVIIGEKDSDTKCIELPPKRWATFRRSIDDVNKNVRAMLDGDEKENVNFRQHIGGGHYVSVNSGYRCVSLRKWFQPADLKGEIRPTRKGISLRLGEWSDLCALVDTINAAYPTLGTTLPCFYGDEHANAEGSAFECRECHPFLADRDRSQASVKNVQHSVNRLLEYD